MEPTVMDAEEKLNEEKRHPLLVHPLSETYKTWSNPWHVKANRFIMSGSDAFAFTTKAGVCQSTALIHLSMVASLNKLPHQEKTAQIACLMDWFFERADVRPAPIGR